MLNPTTFTVTDEAGKVIEVTANHRDYEAYELRYQRSAPEAMDKGFLSVWIFLVWHSMHRRGLTDLDYEAWLDTNPKVMPGAKVEELPPLG